MPLGSSFEYTKQLNAALNSSPQGPCAMPPRQGQSQLISPVSGLNAPSFPASCSNCSGDFSASVAVAATDLSPCAVVGCAVAAFDACLAAFSSLAFSRASICLRFSSTIASTVGRSDSENCGGSGERCAVCVRKRASCQRFVLWQIFSSSIMWKDRKTYMVSRPRR